MFITAGSVEGLQVCNDLVVDRGSIRYVSFLEFSVRALVSAHDTCTTIAWKLSRHTAYYMHFHPDGIHGVFRFFRTLPPPPPEIPPTLITPLSAYSIFTPMLQLDSTELGISVSYNSRSTAWAYFDVRGRIEPKREITAEMHH